MHHMCMIVLTLQIHQSLCSLSATNSQRNRKKHKCKCCHIRQEVEEEITDSEVTFNRVVGGERGWEEGGGGPGRGGEGVARGERREEGLPGEGGGGGRRGGAGFLRGLRSVRFSMFQCINLQGVQVFKCLSVYRLWPTLIDRLWPILVF